MSSGLKMKGVVDFDHSESGYVHANTVEKRFVTNSYGLPIFILFVT